MLNPSEKEEKQRYRLFKRRNHPSEKEEKQRHRLFKRRNLPRILSQKPQSLPAMLLNADTALVGTRVVLVPYRRKHVLKYHRWMEDERIREATASERLTLEEEHAMQESWREDSDKLTFIILLKPESYADIAEIDTEGNMIGDVNIFIKEEGEYELEIMIAEEKARRKGCAQEALKMMISYALNNFKSSDISSYFARINEDNKASIDLFGKLGFAIVKRIPVFEEVEVRMTESFSHPEYQEILV